jgi:hypothetical protein
MGATCCVCMCVNVYVCVCVYATTQIFTTDAVSDTANCCIYPLIPTIYSNQPSQRLHPPSSTDIFNSSKSSQALKPPFSTHTVNSNKPSQPLHPPPNPQTVNTNKPSQPLQPPPSPHTVNSTNHHNHYIHAHNLMVAETYIMTKNISELKSIMGRYKGPS